MVKTYREENIELLSRVIIEDEYNDEAQIRDEYDSQDSIDFVRRNVLGDTVLEIGPGCGESFKHYHITHAIEPSPRRFKRACMMGDKYGVRVRQGFSEAIPYRANMYDSVIFMRGFYQVRSEYETLIEISRVLKIGGRFIFDLSDDNEVFVCGKALGVNNTIRLLRDYGFEVVERRQLDAHREIDSTRTGICVEKIRDFDYRYLKKVQFVMKDMKDVKNFLSERDEVLT